MQYCTHSDKNYLAKGLALYRSLYTYNQNLKLWYLCTDAYTFEKLIELSLPGIIPISLEQLEEFDSELSNSRNNPPSQFGDAYSQFCWTLTPYFTWWLLENKIEKDQELLYCDADLFFYNDPSVIANICSNYSIGIHQHRFTSYDIETNPVGEFNVGSVYFKSNLIGLSAAKKWKEWLLNPNNEYYGKYGTCGDQKYLDLFIPLWGRNVCVFDKSAIAHGAPWNFDRYKYINGNNVVFEGNNQTILFNHFSHFTIRDGSWSSSDHGEWKPESGRDWVKDYYEKYYLEVLESIKILEQ